MNLVSKKVKSLYVGAFYLSRGAKIIGVRSVKQTKKKTEKAGYPYQWVVTFLVPDKVATQVELDRAVMKVSVMENMRRRLKRIIKRELEK